MLQFLLSKLLSKSRLLLQLDFFRICLAPEFLYRVKTKRINIKHAKLLSLPGFHNHELSKMFKLMHACIHNDSNVEMFNVNTRKITVLEGQEDCHTCRPEALL